MNVAVLFAGGVGKRMHSRELPKQFLEIHGKPIIVHTAALFEEHPDIDSIVVSCHPDWISHCKDIFENYGISKVKAVVPGGETGQLSIYSGLCAAEKLAAGERSIVLIHDGVRPLIAHKTITDNLESVRSYGSAITTIEASETVVEVTEDGSIASVPPRRNIRLARAPQSFWLEEILAAHRRAITEGRSDFVDSATMMMEYGHGLHLIDGPVENIKITTPGDFFSMRAILDARENEQIYV
ncbi:IspD/TarI family cytidylyltransferase [Thermophilibacter immobilis]|uniref:2-C-methyl-D-erythritol 4-phosphate cytidylyltransferase n=1 Tax=Thermophilibacter immobilis TaxID=2779519 RepID=A0A7S7M7T9_9ACTN|nr:IspD/TarI family cytidylyltransferase [Thermophilibacter immobilis]QOY60350.1 2-C-methyl-D-erythritol 4-phosphate cytidylyltransferase [Thermophilibacter immobilis]